jgi:hypothetical protein
MGSKPTVAVRLGRRQRAALRILTLAMHAGWRP